MLAPAQKLVASHRTVPLSWLTFVNVKTTDAARRAALACGPIEQLEEPDTIPQLVAGGRQTRGALPVTTDAFDAAVYTSRGRGYAAYNEDGAGLYGDEKGAVYASVFDQAGGLGGSVRGAASELAAKSAFQAFRTVATKSDTDVLVALEAAIDEAHDALVARAEGEVTTAVLVVAREGRAHIVNSGDSAAMHFNPTGQLLAATEKHEVQSPYGIGCLVHAVGLTPEGPAPDRYEWPLSTGDWLLMGSDGLLDSGLDFDEVGDMLAGARSAEVGVNRLARTVLRRMTLLQGKPDNLTIAAIRVL